MIPAWNASGVLPPYVGASPTASALMSPFAVGASHVIDRFATSPERIAILRGWLRFRTDLRAIGVVTGFQWLDGSFAEDCETFRGRPPADLDLVTFGNTPPALVGVNQAAAQAFLQAHAHLFLNAETKARFRCDSMFVNFELAPERLIDRTRYLFGLFSHQRQTGLWKGMLYVALNSDDAAATALLDQREVANAPQP